MVKEAQAKYLLNGKEKQVDLEEAFCPNGYKLTEVGVIPEDWKVSCVGDEYEICNSLRLPISRDIRKNMSGIYPYYGSTKIQDFINEFRVEGEYALIGEDGDHFLKYETMPQTQLTTGQFNVNNHAHLVKGIKNSTKWFFYFFRYRDISVHITRQGAGRFKLNKASLMELSCAFPPNIEQEVIAKALSDVDALITSLEKLIAKKQAIKTATMQQLLTGKKRLPGFGEGKGYKQTELGEIPEDWEVKTYDTVFQFLPTASNSRDDLSQNDEIMYIHYGDIHTKWDFELNLEKYGLPRIAREKFNSTKFLKEGDLVMADASEDYEGIGKSVEVKNIGDKLVISGLHTFLLRDKNKTYVNGFKAYLHSIQAVKDIFDRLATGLKVYGLSKNNLKKVFIPVPSKGEQKAIVGILKTMAEEINLLENCLTKTQQIKQGMMQELLTGKTRLI